jgi:hypothetical protein
MKNRNLIIVVLFIYLALIFIATFPLGLHLNSHIPGFFSTDESYAMLWYGWFNKYCLAHNLSIKSTDLISYPFGIDFYTNKPVGYLWFGVNYLLSRLTTPILTFNIQIFMNLFLCAMITYFLVYYLTKNRPAAFFSGLLFGFSPYLFVRSWQHLGETYLWTMPFVLLWLLRLKDEASVRTRAFFVASLVLTTLGFIFYYMGIAIVVFLMYLVYYDLKTKSLYTKNEKRYFRDIIFFSFLAFLVLIPQFYPVIKGVIINRNSMPAAYNPYYRPFEDLFAQSARPLSYFLPSVAHPLFGKITEQFIGSDLYGTSVTEHTLYLGWTALILAFIAFRKWIKSRKSGENTLENYYIGFFLLLALAAWLFSQPPWWKIGPLKIYMPSFFMYKIMPMFRAYCRFGIVVMLAVTVLAGFGVKIILERQKTRVKKTAFFLLFCGLALFEFWSWPPFKVIDFSSVPGVYYWLKEQPADVVIAEYPLDQDNPNEMYRIYQTVHEKKMINFTIRGTYANKFAHAIVKLSDPATARALKWMGVKYVLVHKDNYLNTELIEDRKELEEIRANPGIKLVGNFFAQTSPIKDIKCISVTGPIDVYEVIAQPKEPTIKE